MAYKPPRSQVTAQCQFPLPKSGTVISAYGCMERTKNTVAKIKNTKACKIFKIILKTKKQKDWVYRKMFYA